MRRIECSGYIITSAMRSQTEQNLFKLLIRLIRKKTDVNRYSMNMNLTAIRFLMNKNVHITQTILHINTNKK